MSQYKKRGAYARRDVHGVKNERRRPVVISAISMRGSCSKVVKTLPRTGWEPFEAPNIKLSEVNTER